MEHLIIQRWILGVFSLHINNLLHMKRAMLIAKDLKYIHPLQQNIWQLKVMSDFDKRNTFIENRIFILFLMLTYIYQQKGTIISIWKRI